MRRNTFLSVSAAFALMLLLTDTTVAEPDSQAEADGKAEASEMSDEDFAKSQIGKTYSGGLDIEGWNGLGGGLVSPPIYVHQFGREDGAVLILTSKETAPAAKGSAASFEVRDALLVDNARKGYDVSTNCMKGDDYTLRFLAEVSGKESSEWWTNVRKAWEIELETGKISTTKARSVKCTNPNW